MEIDQILAITFALLFLVSLIGCIIYAITSTFKEKKQDRLLEV
jgi:hypothetical protein